jgi:hypothetical protein
VFFIYDAYIFKKLDTALQFFLRNTIDKNGCLTPIAHRKLFMEFATASAYIAFLLIKMFSHILVTCHFEKLSKSSPLQPVITYN